MNPGRHRVEWRGLGRSGWFPSLRGVGDDGHGDLVPVVRTPASHAGTNVPDEFSTRVFVCHHDGFCAAAHAQFLVEIGDVVADGFFGDAQVPTDLRIAAAFAQ